MQRVIFTRCIFIFICKSATFKNDQMRTYLSNSLLSNEIICVSHQSGKLHSTSPLGFNSCTKLQHMELTRFQTYFHLELKDLI